MDAYPVSPPLSLSQTVWEKVASWLLLAVGGTVGVGLVAIFVLTLTTSYVGVDLVLRNGKWYVGQLSESGTAGRDGIRSGDEVIAVNGLSPKEVSGGLGYIGASRVRSLKVVNGVGEAKETATTTGPVPAGARQESIAMFVVGAAFWTVGFVSLLRKPQSRIALWLFLMSLSVAVAPLVSLLPLRGWLEIRPLEAVNGFLAPWLMVRFFLEFPAEKRIKLLGKDITDLVYLPPVLLLVVYAWVGYQDSAFYTWFRPVLLWNLATGFLLVIGFITHSYLTASFGRYKQQIKIVAVAAAISLLPFVILAVLPNALGLSGLVPPYISVIGLVLLPLSLGYVILVKNLLDIDVVVSQVVSHSALLLPPVSAKIQQLVQRRMSKGRYDYREAASSLVMELSSQTELEQVLRGFASSVRRFLGLDGACAFVVDREKPSVIAAASGIYEDDVALKRLVIGWARAVRDDPEHQFPNKAPPQAGVAFFVPLFRGETDVGMLILSHKLPPLGYSVDDVYFLLTIQNPASLLIHNALLLHQARRNAIELEAVQKSVQEYATSLERSKKEVEQAFFNTVRTLVLALESRNPYTKQHSERVARLAQRIGMALGLAPEDSRNLEIAGLVHDIGKIGIPDNVLLKRGPLEHQERAEVELHAIRGVEMLRFLGFLAEVIPLVEHHHERYDGTGYPHGLKGAAIPLGARILAVADAYDAMTSERPGQPALSSKEAMERLKEGAGTQWDPQVVTAFQRLNKLDSEAT
ncbi:MAG: HD domain-containing protein [Chloroflexi bacterium]|nr:HD domain-containing protein [Chloroflexota bacterium]